MDKAVEAGNKGSEKASLVLPNQLFEVGPPGDQNSPVYLLETERHFTEFNFHKQKLLFHRASMRSYLDTLRGRGYEVFYLSCKNRETIMRVFERISNQGIKTIQYYDPVDHQLRKKMERAGEEKNIDLEIKRSPSFVGNLEPFQKLFSERNYNMGRFYRKQRKELNILIEEGKPTGGKWTYDAENRNRLPEDLKVPEIPVHLAGDNRERGAKYVVSIFPDNPGYTEDFIYPVTRSEALDWLDDFVEKRLVNFGSYQDAISSEEPFLFHSLLSPLLNSGLLTPEEVVYLVLYRASTDAEIELNSLEGFIRQIIGWREYVRLIYELEGETQKGSNFWENNNPIPESFYNASTGITPVDNSIRRMLQYGYIHHIERLMVLGNFALLCEIDPREIYRWFMKLSIDSYDWVMTPNVFGMSQCADGGLTTTKPYISSSNYIRRMSGYPRGEWCDVWDPLFWRFIDKHSKKFNRIPRSAVMVANLNRMDDDKFDLHRKRSDEFLERLFD